MEKIKKKNDPKTQKIVKRLTFAVENPEMEYKGEKEGWKFHFG